MTSPTEPQDPAPPAAAPEADASVQFDAVLDKLGAKLVAEARSAAMTEALVDALMKRIGSLTDENARLRSQLALATNEAPLADGAQTT